MPSRFASQSSNTQVFTKRIFAQPKIGFLTNHTNLTKEVLGRAHKGLGMSIFVGGTSNLQRRKEKLLYLSSKTSHLELVSKTGPSGLKIGTSGFA
jgi:hypothetical protein